MQIKKIESSDNLQAAFNKLEDERKKLHPHELLRKKLFWLEYDVTHSDGTTESWDKDGSDQLVLPCYKNIEGYEKACLDVAMSILGEDK